jgi:hypothetical protein
MTILTGLWLGYAVIVGADDVSVKHMTTGAVKASCEHRTRCQVAITDLSGKEHHLLLVCLPVACRAIEFLLQVHTLNLVLNLEVALDALDLVLGDMLPVNKVQVVDLVKPVALAVTAEAVLGRDKPVSHHGLAVTLVTLQSA